MSGPIQSDIADVSVKLSGILQFGAVVQLLKEVVVVVVMAVQVLVDSEGIHVVALLEQSVFAEHSF